MFDALHAYGLGILIANVTGLCVELTDSGIHYTLRCTETACSPQNEDLWSALLPFQNTTPNATVESEFFLANWDGMLAALFTTPGVRVASTADLERKVALDSSVRMSAYTKAKSAVARLRRHIERQAEDVGEWSAQVLQHYRYRNLLSHVPAPKRAFDLSIPMTLDPTLSFATRRTLSDGYIGDRINLAFPNSPDAVLLAFVGAARFLRSQRVAGNQVNFYLPLFNTLEIHSDTALPRLRGFDREARQATIYYWLNLGERYGALMKAVAYQTMQTQGPQQSISIELGCLNYTQLQRLQALNNGALVRYWKLILVRTSKQCTFNLGLLVDTLFTQQRAAWVKHFYDYGRQVLLNSTDDLRPYHLSEVKGIADAMKETVSLQCVLKRAKGTLHFGRALRLLSRQNRGVALDLLNELESVQSQDQLVRNLGGVAQQCELATARSEFIIVPDEEDLALLLDDVEKFGVRNIAGLLITLSSLRYPPNNLHEHQAHAGEMNGAETEPMEGDLEL